MLTRDWWSPGKKGWGEGEMGKGSQMCRDRWKEDFWC